MGSREDLHEVLCTILGSRHVYFQPPESVKMVYPAIVYERNRLNDIYANNSSYIRRKSYSVTLIDPDPDSSKVGAIKDLKMCSHDRHFISDNLHHDVFTIYF